MERDIQIWYKRAIVGDYRADLLVEGAVVVEIKVAKSYRSEDEAQLLNELKATGIKVGLLVNFGRTKVEHTRLVF
ncbi:MAG: GxxExxY protein [Pirellulales bacterium]